MARNRKLSSSTMSISPALVSQEIALQIVQLRSEVIDRDFDVQREVESDVKRLRDETFDKIRALHDEIAKLRAELAAHKF
jgi:hypothetical protein